MTHHEHEQHGTPEDLKSDPTGTQSKPGQPPRAPQVNQGQPGPEARPTFFTRPLAKDPIFWTGIAGIVILGSGAAFRGATTLGSSTPFGFIAASIDAAFAVGYGWLIAGFIPAVVRRLIRRSRRKSALSARPATADPSWQTDPLDAKRYRWWTGTNWDAIVSPPPVQGPNKVAWLLVPASAAVFVASFLGGLSSSGLTVGEKGFQVAEAYVGSRDAIGKYLDIQVTPSDPLGSIQRKLSAVRTASLEHSLFSIALNGVDSQDEIGPYPTLADLREYDTASEEFLEVQSEYMERLAACPITDQNCFLQADAWFNANKGNTADRFVASVRAITDSAREWETTR